jgi:hypothetical protein
MPLLTDFVQAARRSVDIATIQYQEGLVDLQQTGAPGQQRSGLTWTAIE